VKSAAATLQPYRSKRDLGRSGEPAGGTVEPGGWSFVVHKHASRQLHYDFRLELDGVLLSWAVPRGPSLDPSQKRLATQVEDHPVEYGSFEGTIPGGQYGAGTVMVWDRGTWSAEGDARAAYRAGHLAFVLRGQKLRGGWHLVRTRRDGSDRTNWLLIKARDAESRGDGDMLLRSEPNSAVSGRSLEQIASAPNASKWESHGTKAGPAARSRGRGKPRSRFELAASPRRPLPPTVEVQLATLVRAAPEGTDWLHEIKFDGYRLIGRLQDGRVKLFTRGTRDWTERFPAIARAITALPVDSAVLDGELVAHRSDGVSDFQTLQNALRTGATTALTYCAFDLLYLNGHDLRPLPLEQRKGLLEQLLAGTSGGALRYADHVIGNGAEVYSQACKLGLEGMVSKRRNAPYRPGRGTDWLKLKCTSNQEFVIGGFSEPEGSRRYLGALLVGLYDDGQLRYCGKVGTGYSEESLRALRARLARLEQPEPAFRNPPGKAESRGVHWVKPELVCEVQFAEFTGDGRLRHPSFRGLREDKPAYEVVRETPDGDTRAPTESPGRAAPLSNPERILYPELGITKLDLANYYRSVADLLLPQVGDRLLTLVRCPEGRHQTCFFQKHALRGMPASIRRVRLAEKGKRVTHVVIDDSAGLLALVQLGVLEIHTGGARARDPERPDLLVFDLDPDPEVAWERVMGAAHLLRDLFGHLGLETFLKTTGGKGLHVCVPILPERSWSEIEPFCRGVAHTMVRAAPDRFVATMSKQKRKGKIFVDYVRNNRGASFIAPYSTRARPGAPLAVPIAWEELTAEIRSHPYTLKDSQRIHATGRPDPWAAMRQLRQSLTPAMLQSVRVSLRHKS
jgi:bifunctional non-homologous end joining protein LigD